MAKQYTCDKCKKVFPQPLDEVRTTYYGKNIVLDMCAKCRKDIETKVKTYRENQLKPFIPKRKKDKK
jgi:ribosomal protein L28